MRTKPSFATKHRDHWERNAQAWGPLSEAELFRNWTLNDRVPELRVEDTELHCALACFYAQDRTHAHQFCRRAILVADRIIAEDLCLANPVCEAGHPQNVALVLRGLTYAKWLLGEPIERKALHRVAEYLAEWSLTKAVDRKRFNDSATMNTYLEGVRAAIITCDLDYGAELLKIKQKFRWHHAVERELWARFISAYPEISSALREEFEGFFDRVRDPDFEEFEWGEFGRKIYTFINREILALETGIIRQMYLVNASPLDLVDATAVIQAVAY